MRKIDILYNTAIELKRDYENKIKNEFDCTKWPTDNCIYAIQANLECSDNIAVASRAFWNSEAIEENLRKEDKIKLFNKACGIEESLAAYRRRFNKRKEIAEAFNYHFDYNKVCEDTEYLIKEMKKCYEDYINYRELDGEINAQYKFEDIKMIYDEYKKCTKDLSLIKKSKLFHDIMNLKEREFTEDKTIDKILDTLYNYDFAELNRSWQIGHGLSDHVIDTIRDIVYARLEKIEPEFEYKYYYPLDFKTKDERINFINLINYMLSIYKYKQRDTRESNDEFKFKFGSLVKLMLNKIKELDKSRNKISIEEYKHRYSVLRQEMKVM